MTAHLRLWRAALYATTLVAAVATTGWAQAGAQNGEWRQEEKDDTQGRARLPI